MEFLHQLSDHLIRLRQYAILLCRNREDAEDLVQETVLRAMTGAATWRPGSDPRPWLYSILHNTFVSSARNYQRRVQLGRLDPSLIDPRMDGNQHLRIEVIETIRALDELPEEQRQAILLVSAGGMTYQEAALALEIPIGTLMSRLARGRAALRSLTAAQEHPSRPHLKIVR